MSVDLEKDLYEKIYKDIKSIILAEEKLTEVDFAFWVQILTIAIDAVEVMVNATGERKQQILITVVVKILGDIIVDEDAEKNAIAIFEAVAPKAIASIIFLTKTMHVKFKRCCF